MRGMWSRGGNSGTATGTPLENMLDFKTILLGREGDCLEVAGELNIGNVIFAKSWKILERERKMIRRIESRFLMFLG